MGTEAERERYESAERAFLQAIRDQQEWSVLREKAVELAGRADLWDLAEHAAWREAADEVSRDALAASTDATELISAIWRDVALAFDGKPSIPY